MKLELEELLTKTAERITTELYYRNAYQCGTDDVAINWVKKALLDFMFFLGKVEYKVEEVGTGRMGWNRECVKCAYEWYDSTEDGDVHCPNCGA